MSFHYPMILWFLALPILWGFWQWVRRGHPIVVPFDHGHQGEGRWLRFFVNLVQMIPALLLSVAVLIAAGPRRSAPPEDERILNNIIICIDMSGSMSAVFGSGSRFDGAVDATKQFCEFRKGDAFGLTVFGSEYLHWLPPTKELSAIRNAMTFIKSARSLPWFGGTMIGNALGGCRDRLIRTKEGDRAIILITDGSSGDFSEGRDRQIAEELASANIRVFTILIGDEASASGEGIQTIAATTGGKVFSAANPATLRSVFASIDQMQKAKFKQVTSDWVDDYHTLALSGMILTGLWGLGMLGLRYTPW